MRLKNDCPSCNAYRQAMVRYTKRNDEIIRLLELGDLEGAKVVALAPPSDYFTEEDLS